MTAGKSLLLIARHPVRKARKVELVRLRQRWEISRLLHSALGSIVVVKLEVLLLKELVKVPKNSFDLRVLVEGQLSRLLDLSEMEVNRNLVEELSLIEGAVK
jgi:hypothetical protein